MPATTGSPFRDACFVTSFSKMGGGKTLDHVASFPRNLVLSLSRELKSAITVLGYHPQIIEVRHLPDVEAAVNNLLSLREKKDKNALYYTGVTIDDMTVLSYRTEQALRSGTEGVGKEKGWDVWVEQRSVALEIAYRIAEKCKQAGLHFAVNGHVRQARTNNAGKFIRGGIDMATDLAETFGAGCDFVSMVLDEPERLFQPTVFFVKNHDANWATKNRLGLPDKVPSNTGEILRSVGYVLPRPVGLESIEDWVEQLAQYIGTAFANGAPMNRVNLQAVVSAPAQQLISKVQDIRHVRWIVRDAIDRAWLRRESTRSILAEVGVA